MVRDFLPNVKEIIPVYTGIMYVLIAIYPPGTSLRSLRALHQFCNSKYDSSYKSLHLTRFTSFDDTVRGGFVQRISAIRTVRNACSTDCHHTLRCGAMHFLFFEVRCGADFFILESTVRCGAFCLEAKSYGAVRFAPRRTVRKKRP